MFEVQRVRHRVQDLPGAWAHWAGGVRGTRCGHSCQPEQVSGQHCPWEVVQGAGPAWPGPEAWGTTTPGYDMPLDLQLLWGPREVPRGPALQGQAVGEESGWSQTAWASFMTFPSETTFH